MVVSSLYTKLTDNYSFLLTAVSISLTSANVLGTLDLKTRSIFDLCTDRGDSLMAVVEVREKDPAHLLLSSCAS